MDAPSQTRGLRASATLRRFLGASPWRVREFRPGSAASFAPASTKGVLLRRFLGAPLHLRRVREFRRSPPFFFSFLFFFSSRPCLRRHESASRVRNGDARSKIVANTCVSRRTSAKPGDAQGPWIERSVLGACGRRPRSVGSSARPRGASASSGRVAPPALHLRPPSGSTSVSRMRDPRRDPRATDDAGFLLGFRLLCRECDLPRQLSGCVSWKQHGDPDLPRNDAESAADSATAPAP